MGVLSKETMEKALMEKYASTCRFLESVPKGEKDIFGFASFLKTYYADASKIDYCSCPVQTYFGIKLCHDVCGTFLPRVSDKIKTPLELPCPCRRGYDLDEVRTSIDNILALVTAKGDEIKIKTAEAEKAKVEATNKKDEPIKEEEYVK